MELQKIVCTSCGNNLDVTTDTSAITCEYCGNTFLLSNGIELGLKTVEEIASIKKLRNNLNRSVLADDFKNILGFSKEILRLIPKDDLANYYFAYANYSFGSRRYLFDFYNHEVQIPTDANAIIDHVIEYSDVRDKSLVETFIARHNPEKIDEYRNRYEKKLIDEENYSSIPRDVFISFRSTELEEAESVLNALENDGCSCWISSRNLRPNDNENYWANIEDAITKCKVFLVVSSHDAMISRDVKRELDIATKQKKQRIEFKVDSSRHTSLFKYFFDGYKWIDATENKEEALSELTKRVYNMLSDDSPSKVHEEKNVVLSTDTSDFTRKINRSKVDMISSNFDEAANSVKDALGINPESADAWWMLFLAENRFQSTELFIDYVYKNQPLSKLAEFYNKVAYKQYKKYTLREGNTLSKSIISFEKKLYDTALEYINKPHLNYKSKKDYLSSYIPNHILTHWSNHFMSKDINTDSIIKEYLDNPDKIKELENIFDTFDDLKNHPGYEDSHLKEYYDLFYKNYDKVLKRREANLKELNAELKKKYDVIDDLISKKKFKDATKHIHDVFYIDNSTTDKYIYLLLAKLKSRNTVELYDSINKLKKNEKQKLLDSIIFEKLYRSEKYSHLIDDIVLHTKYKKRSKKNRILVDVRGEDNEV